MEKVMGEKDGGRKDGEEGQVIVLAAFIIMAGLLVITSMLNGAILSHNVGSRGLQIDAGSLLEFNEVTDNQSSHAIYATYVNNLPRTVTEAKDSYRNYIDNYTKSSNVILSKRGTYIDTEVDSVTGGWQVAQNNSGMNLTSDTGKEGWRVVEDFNEVKMLTLNVTETQGVDDNLTVHVNDSGGSGVWKMKLNTEVNEIQTDNLAGTGSQDHSTTFSETDPVLIKVLNGSGSIDGSGKNLLLDEALTESYSLPLSLEIQGGDSFQGIYDIRVTEQSITSPDGVCSSTPPNPCWTADNRSTGVVINASYKQVYESVSMENSITVDTNMTKASEDVLGDDNRFLVSNVSRIGGGGACTPTVSSTINSMTADNPQGNTWDIYVDWSASACDNDLGGGTVTVTETGSNDQESKSLSPTGGSYSENTTVTFNGMQSPNTFEGEVVINDGDSNTDTDTDSVTP
ncbi:MAG: hypothetical protein ABEK59_01000 [Halobacteria archaeon]